MKYTACLFLIFCSFQVYSQMLTGEWQGHFTTNAVFPQPVTFIALSIKMNTDSTYDIYSYSRWKRYREDDTTVIAKVLYEKAGENSIILQERFLDNKIRLTSYSGLQTMYLKIMKKKHTTILKGNWESGSGNFRTTGKIIFKRKNT